MVISYCNLIIDEVIAKTPTVGKCISRAFLSSHYRFTEINHTLLTVVNGFYAVLEHCKQPLLKKRSREHALMND